MPRPQRGEVWFADLGEPVKSGHEQAGRRYVVVMQTDELGALSTTVVVPLTTKQLDRQSASAVLLEPTEGGLSERSLALCHHLRVLDIRRLERRQGTLPALQISAIEVGVAFILGLPA